MSEALIPAQGPVDVNVGSNARKGTEMKAVIVSERLNTPGTREWVTVEKGEAIFHGFGSDYEEFETGAGNYSAAIVEWPNGQIELVRADRVRFVTPNAANNRQP